MSELKPHFALHRVYFVRSVVLAMREFDPETGGHAEPVNDVEVQPDPATPGLFVASMRCQVNPEKDASHPYHIDMECVCGLQLLDSSLDANTAIRGATITAHSVLYGAIREAVASITGRQPWGPMSLGLSILSGPPTKPDKKAEAL